MSAGEVTTPSPLVSMLLPFTSSARCPACEAVRATPVRLVQVVKAVAIMVSAWAPVRIGLRLPWSVKYWTEPLAQTRGWPSTPAL